jgi:hypothetical protein
MPSFPNSRPYPRTAADCEFGRGWLWELKTQDRIDVAAGRLEHAKVRRVSSAKFEGDRVYAHGSHFVELERDLTRNRASHNGIKLLEILYDFARPVFGRPASTFELNKDAGIFQKRMCRHNYRQAC